MSRIEHWGNPEIESPTQMDQAIEYDYETDNDIQNYREIQGATTYSTTYTHDWAHRLLTEVRSGAPTGFNFNNTYVYDKNGNRMSVNRSGTNYTYGAANANDQFTTGEGFNFSVYNNNGDPTSITQPSPLPNLMLAYDLESRLTSIIYLNGNPTNYFEYNADGMRVQKKVGSTGTPICYVYDGTSVIAEVNGATGAITSYFTPGLAYSRGTEKGYYHANALGSTIGIANADSGIQKSRYSYDAYGIAYTFKQQQSSPYLFAGKYGYYVDLESGMELLGHRYYLPRLGRFLTQDPKGHEVGLNLYRYCENSPMRVVDPDGLDTFVFSGQRLKWFDDTGNLVRWVPAYSGVPGSTRKDQDKRNFGPIPEGVYFIDPSRDEYRAAAINVFGAYFGQGFYGTEEAWGDRRIEIFPTSKTRTYGRNGFYLHGGFFVGSAGCIDIGPNDRVWIDGIGKLGSNVKVLVNYRNWTRPVPTSKSPKGLEWPRR